MVDAVIQFHQSSLMKKNPILYGVSLFNFNAGREEFNHKGTHVLFNSNSNIESEKTNNE